MDIAVAPLDITDDVAVKQVYDIIVESDTVDLPGFPPPCWRYFTDRLLHPTPGYVIQSVLATIDGEPAGYLDLEFPQLDNTENVVVELTVHPDRRRRGVGRALHDYAVHAARTAGRKRLFSMSTTPLSPTVGPQPGPTPPPVAGSAFATRMGASDAMVELRRRLDVSTRDDAALDRALAAAWTHADGYSLVRWYGSTPEEYLDDVAYLDSRLVEDAPMGDLEWEPEKVDAARVRDIEAVQRRRGRRRYHTGLRHDATGRLVAWTLLDAAATIDWHAFQQITIVEPQHRGHRLGTIAKIENLRYALTHEPRLRAIDTWNAAANDHMIAINEAMGFRPVERWHNWQLAL